MKEKYICVLDSGLGGVTVLSELIKLMPNESFIYFGDIENAPYGEKETEEIRNITIKNIEYLISLGAKAIVIACNTATGAAAKDARERFNIPIIGIEPAIKPAVTSCTGKKILVMATPLTLKQEKFDALYSKWEDQAEITLLPCPGLSSIIEQGHVDDDIVTEYLGELFKTHVGPEKPDAIVLGCTHYPLIKNSILKMYPSTVIFDGGEGTARQTKRLLGQAGKLTTDTKGEIKTFTSLTGSCNNEFVKAMHSIMDSLP